MSTSISIPTTNANTAYLFPGQGSQKVGMGLSFFEKSPNVKKLFHRIDEILDKPLSKIIFYGPEEELNKTENAQPSIMAASLAAIITMQESLKNNMPAPAFVAGHSLGEFTAIAATNALDIDSCVYLVQERANLMQKACNENPGTMAAILGLHIEEIQKIETQFDIHISNINTQEQIVISGEEKEVQNAILMAKNLKARKSIMLNVNGAFHSPLMKSTIPEFKKFVKKLDFKNPNIPIVANITGKPIFDSDSIQKEIVSQICECVQWEKTMKFMIEDGITNFIEIGPGTALSSMAKRMGKNLNTLSIQNIEDIKKIK
ncbi:MAG: [acyl-carrier-protein] S-malonyltransferase [Chloroflexi bacterium]|nr:[acyl-carrier-protein] S-malonyltransferase [Chloroflexota bacterium]|tara:strand:+ start:8026 stop:8976 length:951 start_codon:yes stop_codon:yes gene_type:complete